MKQLNQFITEYIIKKKLDKPIDSEDHYEYFPKDKDELVDIISEKIKNMGQSKVVDLSDIDVSKITSLSNMLPDALKKANYYDKIDCIDVTNWDVYNIIDMFAAFSYKFVYKIKGLNTWNISNVKTMRSMFVNNAYFNGEGLENWDVSNVTNMSNMFYGCSRFDGKAIENWDVHNVENMSYMFYGCETFNPDLSKWNTSKVTSLEGTFSYCSKLKGKFLENWLTNNVTNMNSTFAYCFKLECDLSKWQVNEVTDMGVMFYWCQHLNFDLTNWDVHNVKNMSHMFMNCEKMKCKGVNNWQPKAKSKKSMEKMFSNTKIWNFPSWYKE